MLDLSIYLKSKFGSNKKIYLYTNKIQLFKGDMNTYALEILNSENLRKIYY